MRNKWLPFALLACLITILAGGILQPMQATEPSGGYSYSWDGNVMFRQLTWMKVYGDLWLADDLTVEDDATVAGNLTVTDTLACTELQVMNIGYTSARDTVASAATTTLGLYNHVLVTGTADIDSIDTASLTPDGALVYILFAGTAANYGANDTLNVRLSGDLVYTADDVLVLMRWGDDFFEVSRSVN